MTLPDVRAAGGESGSTSATARPFDSISDKRTRHTGPAASRSSARDRSGIPRIDRPSRRKFWQWYGCGIQDVYREHVQQYLRFQGQTPNVSGVGPGNVPDRQMVASVSCPNELRQQRKVEVLNHHHGTVATRFRGTRREFGIHLFVGMPIGGPERGPYVHQVAEWPETLVGKKSKLPCSCRGQPGAPQRVRWIVGGTRLIERSTVSRSAVPAPWAIQVARAMPA